MTDAVADLTARRLHALVAQDQSAGRLPSMVAGVVRDGALVWSGAHGDHTGGPAPTADTQYRIGSITKTMTAVLVMQLRDEESLDLSDRVDKHLPGIGYGDRTIRALLSHSSGMQSEPAGPWWERSPGGGFAELAAAIDDAQAPFAPGHTYHYTNLAFGLLGEIVARHRGGTWWEQVQERILVPLGMTRTSYSPQRPAATGYSVHHFAGTLTEEPAQDTGAMAPAGQAWSTVSDLARYAAFLVEGHDGVLARTTLDEMTIPQSGTLVGGASGGYGLGLRLAVGGSGMVAGHTGSMPGFLAGCFVDRVRRTAALCLANGTSGLRAEGLPLDMLSILEELEPTVPDAWTPAELSPIVWSRSSACGTGATRRTASRSRQVRWWHASWEAAWSATGSVRCPTGRSSGPPATTTARPCAAYATTTAASTTWRARRSYTRARRTTRRHRSREACDRLVRTSDVYSRVTS